MPSFVGFQCFAGRNSLDLDWLVEGRLVQVRHWLGAQSVCLNWLLCGHLVV